MLQRLGWQEGEGLGSESQGIKTPVNKYVFSILILPLVPQLFSVLVRKKKDSYQLVDRRSR